MGVVAPRYVGVPLQAERVAHQADLVAALAAVAEDQEQLPVADVGVRQVGGQGDVARREDVGVVAVVERR